MSLPDITVNVSSAKSVPGNPSDTGQSFAVGQFQRGPVAVPTLLRSMADFTIYNGIRQTTSVMSDWAETFFSEAGKVLWTMRNAGAASTPATINLMDGSAAISLIGTAALLGNPDPGAWANGATGGVQVQVINTSGSFQLIHTFGGVQVEASPVFPDQASAIGWSRMFSNYVVYSLGVSSLVPATAAAASMAGGTDVAPISTDQQNALNLIPAHLGPGQINLPGVTTASLQLQALDHAQKNNRFALLDGADTASDTTLNTAAAALYGAPNNGRRYGQLVAPWDLIPGLTTYTSRTVPPSARLAAEYARVDALGNPNQAAAGRNGQAQFVQDLSQPNWTAAQRLGLNNAGVTISRRRFGGAIKTFGMRTLADQTLDANWSMAPNVRAIMGFVAKVKVIMENHQFNQIDGFGQELGALKGDAIGPAMDMWNQGAIWAPSGIPSDGFYIDTGPSVNPPANLAQGIVTLQANLRLAPNGESQVVNIVKTPITQGV